VHGEPLWRLEVQLAYCERSAGRSRLDTHRERLYQPLASTSLHSRPARWPAVTDRHTATPISACTHVTKSKVGCSTAPTAQPYCCCGTDTAGQLPTAPGHPSPCCPSRIYPSTTEQQQRWPRLAPKVASLLQLVRTFSKLDCLLRSRCRG